MHIVAAIGRVLWRAVAEILTLLWEAVRIVTLGGAHGTAALIRRIAPWVVVIGGLYVFWTIDPPEAEKILTYILALGIMAFGFRVMFRAVLGKKKKN